MKKIAFVALLSQSVTVLLIVRLLKLRQEITQKPRRAWNSRNEPALREINNEKRENDEKKSEYKTSDSQKTQKTADSV